MKRLKNNSGETLIETLVSILITLLAFLALSTALLSAQKINADVKAKDDSFHYDTTNVSSGTVKVISGSNKASVSVKYYTDNGYTYYTAD